MPQKAVVDQFKKKDIYKDVHPFADNMIWLDGL